ncbi:MAG: RNA polymerase sigma-70 factor (ECF subfamily) [Planctomycetota bacterium]|jgi:RNA polymerase sigma-70 factor (ECF subfamily)
MCTVWSSAGSLEVTSMANPEITPELLQAHAGFVRSLARGLLSDDALVDDVVQETFLRALTNGPRHREALSAWLRTVTRNISFKVLRGQSRRKAREEASARSERLPATLDLVARQQSLERVLSSVKALPDHYQEVVMLRFFEDLPPRHIATRLELPISTVRMRLHRALKKLREDLDKEYGANSADWRPSLALLAGIRLPNVGETTALTSTGAAGWNASSLMIMASLAVGLSVGVWYMGGDSKQGAVIQPLDSELGTASDVSISNLLAVDDREREERRLGLGSAPTERLEETTQVAPASFPTSIMVKVVDTEDEPVEGATVLFDFGPEGLEECGLTNAEGFALVEIPPESEAHMVGFYFHLVASARAKGHRPSAVLALPKVLPEEYKIRLRGMGSNLHGRVTDSGGAPLANVLVEVGERIRVGRALRGAQTKLRDSHGGRLKVSFMRDPDKPLLFQGYLPARGYLGDQILMGDGGQGRLPPAQTALTDADGRYALTGLEPGTTVISMTSEAGAPFRGKVRLLASQDTSYDVKLLSHARLRGSVTRADDAPLGPGYVYAFGDRIDQRYAARISSKGRYRFKNLPPGKYTLYAEAGPDRRNPELSASHTVVLRSGRTERWNVELGQELDLRGQLLGESPPKGGWYLELALRANPAGTFATSRSRPDGTFGFRTVPPVQCVLTVRASLDAGVLPLMTTGVHGGQDDLAIQLPSRTSGSAPMRGILLDPNGDPMPDRTQILIIPEQDPTRASLTLVAGDSGQFQSGGLLEGKYFILVPDTGLCYMFPEPWFHSGRSAEPRTLEMNALGILSAPTPAGITGGQAHASITLLVDNEGAVIRIPVFHGSAALPLKIPTGSGRYLIEYPDLAPTAAGTPLSWEASVD